MPVRRRGAAAVLALVLALVAAGLGAALVVARGAEPGGIEEVWALLGPSDLGAVDFAAVARRTGDALACAPGACPGAQADFVVPVLPVTGERLRALVRALAEAEPDTALVFSARWAEEDRYVARSRVLRCPDTVAVAITGEGEGRASLALLSRSQIPWCGTAQNRARLARWLAALAAAAAR